MSAAKTKLHHYVVTGNLPFPIDMLRYDACWPIYETEAHIIEASIRHDSRGQLAIELNGIRAPTPGRWKSFGWTVMSAVRAG